MSNESDAFRRLTGYELTEALDHAVSAAIACGALPPNFRRDRTDAPARPRKRGRPRKVSDAAARFARQLLTNGETAKAAYAATREQFDLTVTDSAIQKAIERL